jgi:hypothetical protein
MTKLEEVAIAICREIFGTAGEDEIDLGASTKAARAAIEAMRAPTHDMLDTGHRAAMKIRTSGISGMTIEAQTLNQCARENAAWCAMIDAILNEGQP